MSQSSLKECLIKHKKFCKSEQEFEVLEEEKATLVENILLVVDYFVVSVVAYLQEETGILERKTALQFGIVWNL